MLFVTTLLFLYHIVAGSKMDYLIFDISDWLINYQGGFVRRGLCGEIIYTICNIVPVSPKWIITGITAISFLLFCRVAWKSSTKLHITLFPFLIFIIDNLRRISWYRRDLLILVIAYYAFYSLARYLSTEKKTLLLLSQALICLSLFMHEATYFFTVPLMALVTFLSCQKNIKEKIFKCFAVAFLPSLVMASVCLMKGNPETAQTIWNSWIPIFENYPDDSLTRMGLGVEFLGRESIGTMFYHLNLNFQYTKGLGATLLSITSMLLTLLCTYYIVMMNPWINIKNRTISTAGDNTQTGNLLLFQFVAMLPMFTGLSCDGGRTIMYSVASALFMHLALKENGLSLKETYLIGDFSTKFSRIASTNRYLSSYWMYVLVVLLYPLNAWGATVIPNHCFFIKIFISEGAKILSRL